MNAKILSALPVVLGLFFPAAQAANIVAGPIANLGSDFLLNQASTGGGDTNAASSVSFIRNLPNPGSFNIGAGGSTVAISGIGWASAGGVLSATEATITITYLGADGAAGGGDDVVFGSVTDGLTSSSSGSTYYWKFDTPLTQTIDAAKPAFLFEITSNNHGNFRFKTTSGTSLSAAKFSIAGTSLAAIPEPSSILLGFSGLLVMVRRRR